MNGRILATAGLIVAIAGAVWHFGGRSGRSLRSADSVAITGSGEKPAPGTPGRSEERTTPGGNPLAGHASSAAVLREFLAALQMIASVTDPLEREAKLDSLVAGMAPGDVRAALEFLENSADLEVDQTLKLRLVRRWAEHDPRAAANWVSEHSTGPKRQDEINGVAVIWAGKNRTEALAWVRQLPEGEGRNAALLTVAYETAGAEPMEAFRIAGELPDNEVRDDLIRHAAIQWAGKNPKEAVAWAGQVEDETMRQQLLAGVTTAWADKEPAAAANAVVDLLPPGRPQEDAVIGIVQRWVQTGPEQAAAWVLDFPGGQLQDSALEEVVKLWTDQNPARAGEWVGQLDGDHRDAAVAAYAGKLAPLSPQSAVEWAESIGDETLRSGLMETVAASWMISDPAAARHWVASADFPEATRARLLSAE